MQQFQSTPPRGRRLAINTPPTISNIISIHASAREATPSPRIGNPARGFQSTPPRGRRRAWWAQRRRARLISIHASAREATLTPVDVYTIVNISIHASAREATSTPWMQFDRDLKFQSTPPRGRRRASGTLLQNMRQFQSTPPRGRRLMIRRQAHTRGNFNPRLREGGDAGTGKTCRRKQDFNPRLREGGDIIEIPCFRIIMISIHASAREATLQLILRAPPVAISIHASAREATRFLEHLETAKTFQSTPPRGRRLVALAEALEVINFNPRLREGGDCI